MTHGEPTEEQRRRKVRLTAVVLALVALGIYVAFIASSVLNSQQP